MWGYFICAKQARAWRDIEPPDAFWIRKLEEACELRKGRIHDRSVSLTPTALENAKNKLETNHYNWLYVSVWFGLRPREINNLLKDNENLWYIDKDPKFGFILAVFQQKLYERGVAKEKCWKYIPTVFKEQKKAIILLLSKELKQPLALYLRRVFGDRVTAYGGRQNFVGFLRDSGYDLETTSKWMGHLSVKTTEKDYSRNTGVFYRPPVKKS
jgi:integrase